MNFKIAALVVTYNRLPLLKEVIDELRKQTYSNMDIIVVNNGSTDDTSSWLKQQNDIITINQSNTGGAGGFNTGMRHIAEHDYDACWLMDDDVICSPNALEELLYAIQKNDNIGFVCSKVIGIDGTPMNVPMVDQRKRGNNYQNWMDYLDCQMVGVEACTFVSVLIPTRVIKEVGLPYKEYFIWGDDSEYTTRITRKYQAFLAAKSVVIHKRAIQGDLRFDTEDNPIRIKNFFYYFRNQTHYAYLYRGYLMYLKRIIIVTLLGFRMLFTGKFKKAKVAFASQLNAMFFRPKVEHVKKD